MTKLNEMAEEWSVPRIFKCGSCYADYTAYSFQDVRCPNEKCTSHKYAYTSELRELTKAVKELTAEVEAFRKMREGVDSMGESK